MDEQVATNDHQGRKLRRVRVRIKGRKIRKRRNEFLFACFILAFLAYFAYWERNNLPSPEDLETPAEQEAAKML